jgi:hypothetical protein
MDQKTLARKLLDVSGRIHCGETLWRDHELVGEAAHALVAASKAMGAMLTQMGMDEDEWNKPTFDQMRAAVAQVDGITEP